MAAQVIPFNRNKTEIQTQLDVLFDLVKAIDPTADTPTRMYYLRLVSAYSVAVEIEMAKASPAQAKVLLSEVKATVAQISKNLQLLKITAEIQKPCANTWH